MRAPAALALEEDPTALAGPEDPAVLALALAGTFAGPEDLAAPGVVAPEEASQAALRADPYAALTARFLK